MNANNINNAKRNLEQTNKTMDCVHILCPRRIFGSRSLFKCEMCFVINVAVVAQQTTGSIGVISYLQNFELLSHSAWSWHVLSAYCFASNHQSASAEFVQRLVCIRQTISKICMDSALHIIITHGSPVASFLFFDFYHFDFYHFSFSFFFFFRRNFFSFLFFCFFSPSLSLP